MLDQFSSAFVLLTFVTLKNKVSEILESGYKICLLNSLLVTFLVSYLILLIKIHTFDKIKYMVKNKSNIYIY